jgi:hypothetical protein
MRWVNPTKVENLQKSQRFRRCLFQLFLRSEGGSPALFGVNRNDHFCNKFSIVGAYCKA